MKNKIISVTGTLSKDGVRWMEIESDIEKKSKIYVLTRFNSDNEKIVRNIPIDDLLLLRSAYSNSVWVIGYTKRCYPENLEETKSEIIERIKLQLEIYKKALTETESSILKIS